METAKARRQVRSGLAAADHPRFVVASLVLGPLLGGCHGGELIGSTGWHRFGTDRS